MRPPTHLPSPLHGPPRLMPGRRAAVAAAGAVGALLAAMVTSLAFTASSSATTVPGPPSGWTTWKTVPANMSEVTGTHTVYRKFVSGASGRPAFVSLHYFNFPVS